MFFFMQNSLRPETIRTTPTIASGPDRTVVAVIRTSKVQVELRDDGRRTQTLQCKRRLYFLFFLMLPFLQLFVLPPVLPRRESGP